MKALTDLIMDKFEQDTMAFYEWVAKIHDDVIETLPETVEQQQQPTIVKILEWDPGRFLGFSSIFPEDLRLLTCVLASSYRGSVTNGVFKDSPEGSSDPEFRSSILCDVIEIS